MTKTFDVAVQKLDDEVVVKITGDVDLTTVKVLTAPLLEGVETVTKHADVLALSVDLRQVDFIDSAGLALLINARKRLAPAKQTLQIFVTEGQQPDRVLRLGCFDMIMRLRYDASK